MEEVEERRYLHAGQRTVSKVTDGADRVAC
jgi:hypothetical protein